MTPPSERDDPESVRLYRKHIGEPEGWEARVREYDARRASEGMPARAPLIGAFGPAKVSSDRVQTMTVLSGLTDEQVSALYGKITEEAEEMERMQDRETPTRLRVTALRAIGIIALQVAGAILLLVGMAYVTAWGMGL